MHSALRTITHTFADGVTRLVCMIDATILVRLEDTLRERKISAVKKHLPPNQAETYERLIHEETREISLVELLGHLETVGGMRDALAEALREANPDMDQRTARGLLMNMADVRGLLTKVNPRPAPQEDGDGRPTVASSMREAGTNQDNAAANAPAPASANSVSSFSASMAGAG